VIFEATRARNTLVDFRRRRIHPAGNGENGTGGNMYGAAATDLTLPVPIGTVIYEAADGEILADLDREGAQYVIPGGQGGRGNTWFKTSTRQTPRVAEDGKPGIEKSLRLELKLMADVGLLGFPNAGKSTLISRISAARPKVADYPFTTLTPQLGVVSVAVGESFVVADIPGLIEGAAEGRGLGHQFLRHVERCTLYLHLVAPDDPDVDPVSSLHVIEEELRAYDPALLERPRVIVLTKIDLLEDEARERLSAALHEASGLPVYLASAVTGEGIEPLVWATWKTVRGGE
jgi:GTP-binding protein